MLRIHLQKWEVVSTQAVRLNPNMRLQEEIENAFYLGGSMSENMAGMHVVIAGGSGFIGHSLSRYLMR